MNSQAYSRDFVKILEKRMNESDPLIQAVLGPRQVGKTTGIQLIVTKFENCLYTTADEALIHTRDWIQEQWQTALALGPNPILILDEVQKVMQWSEEIKRLWDSSKRQKTPIRVILLGSSSLDLSLGLEESLTGRFEIISAPHWGFQESKNALGFTLPDYLQFGGYPAAARFKTEFERWQSYLQSSILETVIGKDILRFKSVKNPALFRQAFQILTSYPAQEVSYNKVLGQLQEKGNVELVKHYLALYEGAFLIRALEKYSGSSQIRKSSSPKILPLCPSLSSYHFNQDELSSPDVRGRLFEICVGVELARLPGRLYYWREGNSEVDFIYLTNSQLFAIEVKSGSLRKSSGLGEFQKRHPQSKSVYITLDNFDQFSLDPEKFLLQFAI